MASVTFAADDSLKAGMAKFQWVNWSEAAREELAKKEEKLELLEEVERIASKSKLTEEEADRFAVELGREMKKGRFEKLRKLGLV